MGSPADSRARSKPSRIIAPLIVCVCWMYAAAVLGGWILIRAAGERWWPATLLLYSPRWLWAVPAPPLILVALVARRRWVILPFATGTFALFALLGFNLPWRASAGGTAVAQTIRLLTCNQHREQTDPAVLNRFVAQMHPDLILIQDYTSTRSLDAVKDGTWFTDRVGELYIASRYPIHRQEKFALSPIPEQFDPYQRVNGVAVGYDVELPGGSIRVVNLHLSSPHAALQELTHDRRNGASRLTRNSQRRRDESRLIASHVRQLGEPVLLAGDFNTPPDSPIFREAWNGFEDAFDAAGLGFGTTYVKHHTWLRIDHVLSWGGWRCRSCFVGPEVGSGHRPLFAELER